MNTGNAIQLAIENFQSGNLEETVNICQKILDLQSTDSYLINFVGALFYQVGLNYQEKGQLQEAIYFYQKAIQIDSNITDAYYNLGTIFKRRGQLDEAITCYQKVLQINPGYIEAYYDFVDAVQEKAKPGVDSSYYNRIIQDIPNYLESYLNLGVVFEERGLLDEAITCYEKVLHIQTLKVHMGTICVHFYYLEISHASQSTIMGWQ